MTKHNSLIQTESPYCNIPALRLTPDEQLQAGIVAPLVHVSSKQASNLPKTPAYPVRNMSPNELASVAYDLYMQGELERDEYLLLGFPSETHPYYNQTVGALTGEIARPHQPRDLIYEWEEHLMEINASALPLRIMKMRAQKILGLLRWLEHPAIGKTFDERYCA